MGRRKRDGLTLRSCSNRDTPYSTGFRQIQLRIVLISAKPEHTVSVLDRRVSPLVQTNCASPHNFVYELPNDAASHGVSCRVSELRYVRYCQKMCGEAVDFQAEVLALCLSREHEESHGIPLRAVGVPAKTRTHHLTRASVKSLCSILSLWNSRARSFFPFLSEVIDVV